MMAVKTFSLAADGNKRLSDHFRVNEFACKDGSDRILISEELVGMLERLRGKLGCSININSGYRTESHNRKVGGSETSKHCLGLAADVICRRNGTVIPAAEVCCAAQSLGFTGIGFITAKATHVDVRPGAKWWADESRGNTRVKDFYAYFGIPAPAVCPYPAPTSSVRRGGRGNAVKWVQWHLIKLGFPCGEIGIDGSCGPATVAAIREFQRSAGLDVDGVCGPLTRAALSAALK